MGYGKTNKKDLVTAVSSVEMNGDTPIITDIGEFLMGKVPGLVVTKTGSSYRLNVRGATTVSGVSVDPLVLLDGDPDDVLRFMQNSPKDAVLLCYDEEAELLKKQQEKEEKRAAKLEKEQAGLEEKQRQEELLAAEKLQKEEAKKKKADKNEQEEQV